VLDSTAPRLRIYFCYRHAFSTFQVLHYFICHFVYLSRHRWKKWNLDLKYVGSRSSCAVHNAPCGGFGFGRRLAEISFRYLHNFPSDMLSALKGRGKRRRRGVVPLSISNLFDISSQLFVVEKGDLSLALV
jgi:hypothetical protein